MALDFPNSPTIGQVFTAAGSQWGWNGTSWDSVGTQLAATSPITYVDGEFGFDALAYAQQENFELLYVKNTTGSTIAKGSAVYISGATGDNALIAKARANAESTSSKTIGLIYADIANDGFGYVVTTGKLTGINTSTATAGDPVWLSPDTTGGLVFGLASKPSAPNHLVYIGIVLRAHANNGEIEIRVQNGFELEELHNVSITAPATGDIIQWNGSNLWVNKTITGAGIAALASPTFTGTVSTSNLSISGTTKIKPVIETATLVSSPFSTLGYDFDVLSQAVVYITGSATGSGRVRFRGNSFTTLASLLGIGESITLTFLNTNGATGYYINAIEIDGIGINGIKWLGGTAPSGGNANAVDAYTYTIMKTAATPTYSVFASVSKFA